MRSVKALRRLSVATRFKLRQLDAALMPVRCAFCGTRTRASERGICDGCRGDLPWLDAACRRCAEPLPAPARPDASCPACQQHPPPFRAAAAPLRYAFPVDAGLKALKFERRLYYAAALGELLADAVERLSAGADALLPVPLHWRRHAWRGFNQAAELARPVAHSLKLPIIRGVVRRRATRPQSALAADRRRSNLRDAFVVRVKPAYRHVVIIDDVITTGATVTELTRTLLEAGVGAVSVLAVARASSPSRRRPD